MRDRTLSLWTLSGASALLWIVTGAAPAQARDEGSKKLHTSLSVDVHFHASTGSPHRDWRPHRRSREDDGEGRHHRRKLPPRPSLHHGDHDRDSWDSPRHDRGRHLGWDHAPGHLRKEDRDRDDH